MLFEIMAFANLIVNAQKWGLRTYAKRDYSTGMKSLSEWIEEAGETQVSFAARAGINQSVISRMLKGGDAKGRTWAAITKATDGEVTPGSNFPDVVDNRKWTPGPRPRRRGVKPR
jgi:predicted transcriptional regulator